MLKNRLMLNQNHTNWNFSYLHPVLVCKRMPENSARNRII